MYDLSEIELIDWYPIDQFFEYKMNYEVRLNVDENISFSYHQNIISPMYEEIMDRIMIYV